MALTQENRAAKLRSPLEPDLVFQSLRGSEGLSKMFKYEVTAYSEKEDLDLDALLGKFCYVEYELPEGGMRYYSGFVAECCYLGHITEAYGVYLLVLRPWLWFLTRSSDCKIFQSMNAIDIIKQVFTDQGFTDFDDKLTQSYREREYTVQYRETAHDFVCRLMEEEGVYFYFKHSSSKHTLVLSDGYVAHSTRPNYATIPYFPELDNVYRTRDHIYRWQVQKKVRSGKVTLSSYDFKAPKKDLEVKSDMPKSHDQSNKELYDYQNKYITPGEGNHYAQVRREEAQSRYERCFLKGSAMGITSGYLFTMEQNPRDDQNREYLTVEAHYELTLDEYRSTPGGSSTYEVNVTATVMPANEPYRPQRITPKPNVGGPLTALVVGKSGEEIWTEKYGRIKVQFHWDREGSKNEDSSCWIRVGQPWAAKNWGAICIPRIGQEVVISFIEGDPDMPLCTGAVYNDDNKPPFSLPGSQNITGFKSNTTKGGGGYNEMVMDDTSGNELIRVHAQYNSEKTVENDQTTEVRNDEKHTVVKNREKEVKVNEDLKVGGNQTEKITGKRDLDVTGTEDIKITASSKKKALSVDVSADTTMKLKSNASMSLQDSMMIKAQALMIKLN